MTRRTNKRTEIVIDESPSCRFENFAATVDLSCILRLFSLRKRTSLSTWLFYTSWSLSSTYFNCEILIQNVRWLFNQACSSNSMALWSFYGEISFQFICMGAINVKSADCVILSPIRSKRKKRRPQSSAKSGNSKHTGCLNHYGKTSRVTCFIV